MTWVTTDSEKDGCGAGFGKVRVCEGRAEEGGGGGRGGDNVAGIAARVVGKVDDRGYITGWTCGLNECQLRRPMFLLVRERARVYELS